MANTITLIKKAITALDEVYKASSKTAVLDSDSSLAQAGANANEILIPKITMDGLGDYSREKGYAEGSVNVDYETKKFNYDRSKKFNVDAMDNEETAGIAFGMLSSQFMRTKVVPEIDAFRLATYAQKAGHSADEDLTTGKTVLTALRAGANVMEEAEVDVSNCVLFINPTHLGAVEDLDTTASKAVLNKFAAIVSIPQNRLFDKIKLDAANGFSKDSTGKDVNFIIIDKQAVMQYAKHNVEKVIAPDQNQSSDAWMFAYRDYELAEVYDNKVNGIYVSKKTA